MTLSYEKLGAFYLGKEVDPASGEKLDDLVLYDSKDLTTHAVIIGMTGSGKTGLGIGLLEEALIDSIPVIAIDPKGDLPNLLLNFPELNPEDLEPWIDPHSAATAGQTQAQFAAAQSRLWKKGIQKWDQSSERIKHLGRAADFTVYTPGSNAGRPVSLLRRFNPPPRAIMEDNDLRRDRIQTTVASLLSLLGIEADPLTSREHILLSNILEKTWELGNSLDLPGLIQAVQSPPFERIGVMDLEFVFPAKDRFGLAMRINNLLASPGFESWMEGDPLDVGSLLYTDKGKPRASIFTISHLTDDQRMFFVSTLLNEILGWVRTQPGTSSLRAILYMDEIFGFFPPVSNPPSKAPLLTLLKQARAYGLGVVLSTQNPVDLDYKGLANTGTWFIGRLQTQQDQDRVLAGLEGASAMTGNTRGDMEKQLAGLDKRVFLLHNVHEQEPVLFHTRWTLSYLAGPMTRSQLKALYQMKISGQDPVISSGLEGANKTGGSSTGLGEPFGSRKGPSFQKTDVLGAEKRVMPNPPGGVDVFYLSASGTGRDLLYRPAVVGRLDVHYLDAKRGVDTSQTIALAVELEDGPVVLDWDNSMKFDPGVLETKALSGAGFDSLPAGAKTKTPYKTWKKDLMRWVRQNQGLVLYKSTQFKLTSSVDETEGQFRGRVGQAMHEKRDLTAEKLRRKYERRFTTLKDRIMRAEQAVSREKEQAKNQKIKTVISFGSAILGAFLGRKAVSVSSASKMGTAMKSASRMGKEAGDIARAKERIESLMLQLQDLEDKFQQDLDRVELDYDAETTELKEILIRPKQKDMTLEVFGLGWMPYRRDAAGQLTQDWR